MITVGAVVESESFGASVTTFAAAADCVSLVSQLDNPAVVKRLYVLAAGNPSFETSLIAQRFLKTVDNVQSMLKVIADINADATSRSLLLEIIRSNTELAILAYEQGMITVCVDIVKENKSYDLVAVAIDMLNTTKLECHRCLLMKTLGEFLCDLEIGDETLKLKTAQTLRRLSGWRYSETETWYTYRYSCIFDLVEEAGAVESICNTLRSTSSADIAMEICYLVTAFLFKYSKEGFSVFLDVGIVDILLHKLESFDSNVVSCTPPLVTLEAVTRTEAGICQIIGTPMDLENILSKLLGLERFKMQDGLPLLENSVYTRSLLSILSRISFSTRISPLINQLMDVDDPNSIFWVGFFMRHSMSGAICFRTKVYDLLTSSLTTSDGACAILELHTVHLLRGYLVHCEKKYIDVLVSKGILKILMATVMGESDTNSLVLIYALRCISSICDGSQVALREVYSSGIIQYLPSGIEHGSYHVFDACNDLLKKILEVEEGALKLPMTKLLHAFSARLNIPDMYFENTHSYDSSPFPCAQKVAETIKSVVEMQPPHTKEVIREQLFQTVFEQVWKLVRRLTFTGIVYFKIMTKFMDLLKCLAKCKLFKSVQNAALARISLIEITESEFLEAVYFLYSFDENIDDGVAKEKLSHILDGQLYQQMTCERRAHICLALSRSCFSKSFIAKYCQRVIFESISHVLNEALMFSWDEVYGAMMLTYHVVDKSSDDIVDVVLSRNILKNILTYYQNSQILIHTNIILLLLSSVLQKAIRVGEAKLENVASVLIDNDIGVIIGELARDDRAEKKYPSLMKIMGYLIAAKTGSVKLGPMLQDFSFQQLITMRGVCSEAMFAIINDEKVFNRVVDNVKSLSSWECLPRDEKCCALELFCCFAFPMSPYKSISMTFVPHVNSLLRTHTSKLSSSFCGICHNSLRFLVLGILNGYCESNNFNSPELVDLIFQLAINSYKVSNYDERFNDTAILICTCLDKNTANSVGFVRHFVSTLISSVSGTNGVVLSAVIELCKKLYPSNNTDIIVNKLEAIFVEAGGLQALMTIINVPVIDRIRPVVFNACNVVGFLLECEEAICKFDELNGSNITLALLRDEVNIPQYFLYILLKYIIRTTWSNSSRLLDGGLLDVLTPAALEGVKSKGFFMTLQILQLICVRGSDRHREKIAKSETCEIIVQFLIDGSCPHDYVARASYLLGYNLQFNPRARSYIAGLVDLISISDPRVALGVIEKLKGVCDSQCRYVFEFLNTHSISTKLLPIYEHDKYNQSERGTIAGFIFLLARETPKEFASFGKALIKKIRSRLDDFETPNNSPKIISYIAKYSQNAKAFIISSMHQITSDYDSGNEQYACIILKMLHSICASHDGMSVLVEGGAINVLSQILAIARTKDMKIAILNLLDRLSALECNRSKLSDIIEPVFQLITSHVHMELNDQLLVESSEFTETDAKNSFTFNCFLSHDWGIDELGRNNHERVSKINSLLKSKGCKTWFDEEQMRGSIASKMAKGVADSTAFVVFLTKNYILKASGLGSKGEDDNCFFEFDTAALERGRSNMIAVILEPSCRDTSKWAAGIVKGKLGTKLYIDLSGNENEESFQEGIAKLLREISLLSGKSFETDSVTLNSNAESLKSRRYKDVAYSESDREIGKKGIELLASLSLSESNRSAFERIDSLLPNLEYFCENKALEIVTPLYSLAVLANVYCPYLDLPSHSEENSNRNTKIRQCLKSCDYFNLLRESVKRAATSSKTDRGQLASLEAFLLCTVSLTYMEEFCEDEITLTFLEDLVTILIESSESLVSLEIVHKMHICDVFTKFCQNEKCRKKLISLKVGELVRGINDSVKANDDVQDNARLWFSSKQTMEALTGQLEISNNANFKASQLIEKGSAMTVKEIAAIPVFQTFISYKRTSAQDFARLLHSIITGNGWSCFLDVENLDRIDMLSVLVAGADVFVCILSDDVFHSPFWKQELNYAIKAGIPVVLVVKDGSRFPDTYGQLTEPFPSYDLIDKEFSGDLERCREVFKSKAIHHSNEYFRSFSVNFLKKVEAVLDEMNQKYQSAAKKKEIIIGRRQSILSIDKLATDTIVNVIPRAQESASVNPVAVQIQHPQTPNQKSPNASQISFSNQPQPPIAYTNQPPHQIYPSHSHYSGVHSPHQYMNQPHHQVSHASIHPHPQMLYPTINPQFQIQPLAYNYTSIQPYMPLAQPQSPLSYAGSSLTTPHSPTHYPQSSMILGNYESSSNSPGLLSVTEVIKQIFGIDPNTPLLETINIVETSLFGAVGNASFPSRVQAIKSALGLP